ncbi:transcriptional regulator FilR1 domain-containing protein [Halorubrum lipolyticum]|uniref:Transcriptional regulator n=1 Tax=Halorubrum lipolyticum DSM 21995 TaxID=1227482 RepID=M0NZ67_9EURY|nr:MarR family transcriptional regulator [Halorubrum lipolyticum]EMA62544.1 transcriptional regulator [Halorubrum lipolyticum DSM 21995]
MEAPSGLVEVAERRLDFLERLVDGALRKHELVDELGHSRSTVNRAIDELEAAGLVAGETDGYRTTLTGRLLARSYRRFLTVAADVDAATETLAPLGPGVEISPAALRDADTYRAAAPDPYRPLERIDGVLAEADGVAAALPALPYPRLLDRLRRVADAGEPVDLALTDRTYRHARERYADTLGELSAGDRAAVSVADGIDVGCLVADETAILVVFDADGGVHGVAESADPEAVAWARDRVRSLGEAGRDVTEELAAIREARAARDGDTGTGGTGRGAGSAGGSGERSDNDARRGGIGDADVSGFDAFGAPPARGGGGPDPLSAQGFVALDDGLLGGDADPTGPLHATPSFAEVDAGYVLDRTALRDGSRRSIADRLIEGLAAGDDHALVGPAGSGKSTVCRLAAVRWHRSGRGPVLYRPGDEGEPFSATDRLRERAVAAEGHALVVVEDVVDADAADAVGVARGLADRDDVSFLFDAREERYDDPDSLPLNPSDLEYRRRIESRRMPRLDERETERLAAHVAELTGTEAVADPGALLDAVRRPEGDRPGELLCLVHHLVRTGDLLDDAPSTAGGRDGNSGETDETGLEASVSRAVRDLTERPPPTAGVAVLANLLNVAGVSDVREFAYALADDETAPEAVQRALDRLSGTVLVPTPTDPDRAVHQEWSVLFLERLLEREPEPVVARRVGRAATRVLELADDPARRSRIRRAVGGDAPAMDRIERDPEAWAADAVRAVYGVGRRYPRLAGLYGRVRYSWIDLPDACPADLRDRAPEWVVRMYVDAGDLDGATDALDAWRPANEAGEAERQRGYGDVARRRGEYDAARERFDRAAALFSAADDRRGLAAAVRGRAQAAHFAGDYEAAYEAASRAHAIGAAVDDPIAIAKSLMDIGNALDALDGTDAVIDHYRVARGLFETYDDTHGEANVRTNLAVARRRRGELAAAKREAQRALDGYRTVGDEHREAVVLLNLGAIAEQRGEVGEAAAHAREARAIADRVGSDLYRAFAVSHLGSAAQLAGDLDRAERYLRDALAAFEDLDADSRRAMVAVTLAEVELRRGDLDAAERWLDRTESLLDEHAGRRRLAMVNRNRGVVALERGDLDRAAAALESGLEQARAGGFTAVEARALADRGRVAAERENTETALDRLTAALDLGRRIECVRAIVPAAEALAALLASHPDPDGLGVDAPGPIGEGSATDPAAYRDLADRWRADADGVAADFTASGSEAG